jgi:heme-degrading monooxygenase HmoA
METAFEAAFEQAVQLLRRASGYRSQILNVSVESLSHYLLVVDWEALEDHTIRFRSSPDHVRWKEMLDPFYASKPQSLHFERAGNEQGQSPFKKS